MTSKLDRVIKPPPLPESISPAAQGRRLKALLKTLGWSQVELVRRTGINQYTISHYCRGQRGISGPNAYLIAEATGLPTDYILSGATRRLTMAEIAWLPDA